MFNIDNNNDIRMSKGESVSITVPLHNTDLTPYTMSNGDKLTLSIKENLEDSTIIKTFTSTTNVISIPHNGTSKLSPGLYRYDILLVTNEGNYFYIIEPHIFELIDVIGS